MPFSVWGFVFLVSGSVFLFWVSHFVLCVSVLGLVSPIFVVVVVVLWFFCFYQPPYIFDSPLQIQPLENTSKLRRKFLHRDQIVQVRNNLL